MSRESGTAHARTGKTLTTTTPTRRVIRCCSRSVCDGGVRPNKRRNDLQENTGVNDNCKLHLFLNGPGSRNALGQPPPPDLAKESETAFRINQIRTHVPWTAKDWAGGSHLRLRSYRQQRRKQERTEAREHRR